MMDSFFDCTNERNPSEHKKIKAFLKPYTSIDDDQFTWLIKDFLGYFSNWRNEIEVKFPNLTATEKSKMFIAWQTYEGLQITTYSLIGCIKYLLGQGVECVERELLPG